MKTPHLKSSSMKSPRSFMQNRLVPIVLLAVAPAAVNAANIWDGGAGTGNWADALNWDNNAVPSNSASLHFAGSTQPSTTNNTGTITAVNGLVFDAGASSFTLAGNALTLNSAGAVTNSSTSNQTIALNLALTSGAHTFSMTSGGGNIIIGSAADATKGLLSSTGSISTGGTGSLTLYGNNTFSGGVSVGATNALNINNGGTDSTNSAIGTGTLAIAAGATIDNTRGSAVTVQTNNAVNLAASFTFGGSNDLTFGSGAISNTQSANTVTLNGSNKTLTFGGVATNTASGSNITLTVNGTGNTLVFGGYNISNGASLKNLTIAGSGNVTITGAVTDSSSTATLSTLTYNGTGTLTLSGANTYTGKTTIGNGTSNGTVQFARQVSFYNNGAAAAWSTAAFRVNAGATMAFNVGGTGEFTSSDIATLSALTGSTAGFTNGAILGLDTTNASGGVFTLNSALGLNRTGQGLTKLGSGTLVLSVANTYSGATFIKAGTLALGTTNALATGTAITLGGGTLSLGGFSQAAFTNALTMTAGSTIDFGSHVGGLTLTFGDSHLATWTGSLSLLNFTVGTDNLSFTSISGLTVGQLAQISLAGYTVTGLDASGNVQFSANSIPEPSVYALILGTLSIGVVALSRRRRVA